MIPSAVSFVSDQVVKIEAKFEVNFSTPDPENKTMSVESRTSMTYASSGFIIGEDVIVTAHETLIWYRPIDLPEETEAAYELISLSVYLADGTKYAARPAKTDPKNNVAILELIGLKFPHPGLKFSIRIPEKYDTVWVLGHVYFDNGTVIIPEIFYDKTSIKEASESGALRFLMQEYGYESLMRLSGELKTGMLGGPILNKEGEVIGIIWRSYYSLNFAISADIIQKFVDEYFNKI